MRARSWWIVSLAMVSIVAGLSAQTARPRSPLEDYAAAPGTRVAWSAEAGRVDTPEARLTISAVVLANDSLTPGRMRGVRVDLQRLTENMPDPFGRTWAAAPNDTIYIEDDWIARVRDAMREIEDTMGRQPPVATSRGLIGAREFWGLYTDVYASDPARRFNAAHYVWNGTAGVTVSGFWFQDRSPADIEVLLTSALAALAREAVTTR
jgi:hypothetical protein